MAFLKKEVKNGKNLDNSWKSTSKHVAWTQFILIEPTGPIPGIIQMIEERQGPILLNLSPGKTQVTSYKMQVNSPGFQKVMTQRPKHLKRSIFNNFMAKRR